MFTAKINQLQSGNTFLSTALGLSFVQAEEQNLLGKILFQQSRLEEARDYSGNRCLWVKHPYQTTNEPQIKKHVIGINHCHRGEVFASRPDKRERDKPRPFSQLRPTLSGGKQLSSIACLGPLECRGA